MAELDKQEAGSSQLVSFRLAKEEYAVNIMQVQEIILMGEITNVPQVPEYVEGVINLRGNVIPIVDLRKRFGLVVSDETEETRIIVVNVGDRTVGIIVDAVNEVLRITADKIDPPPPTVVGVGHEYLTGMAKLDDKLLILLDITKILSSGEQDELNAVASEAELAATA